MELVLLASLYIQRILPPSEEYNNWETSLNSDNYEIRECATRHLELVGTLSLCKSLNHSQYPEVRHRARPVYNSCRSDFLSSLRPYPSLEMLYYDKNNHKYLSNDHQMQRLVKDYYDKSCYDSNMVWVNAINPRYRIGSMLWASDLLDQGVPPCIIRSIFKEMWVREQDYMMFGRYSGHWFP